MIFDTGAAALTVADAQHNHRVATVTYEERVRACEVAGDNVSEEQMAATDAAGRVMLHAWAEFVFATQREKAARKLALRLTRAS